MFYVCILFFFKQKTAYDMRISDWRSDVCSSDLNGDSAAHRSAMGDVRLLNAKKFAFGFLAIHHEAALECVTGAFDVSQKRGKKASGATLCRRQHQVAVARCLQNPCNSVIDIRRQGGI